MTTDTTPTTPPVHAPFARPERAFLTKSVADGASDWELTHFAISERSFAVYNNDPDVEEARRLAGKLTRDEAVRVDAFLAAGVQDTDRLDAIAAGRELTEEDRTWLLDQLRLAWQRLDRLRDAIDRSGSMMDTTYVARSVGYVRWSRRPEAITGHHPHRTDQAGA